MPKPVSTPTRHRKNEQTRAALLRLSEDWLRMAEGWDDPPSGSSRSGRAIFQQQQQVQLKDDGE